MRHILISCVLWILGLAVAIANVLEAYDPNQFVAAQSESYARDAPDYGPGWGGIIFGKGDGSFFIDRISEQTQIPTHEITLMFSWEDGLRIFINDVSEEFSVTAHNFSVCPMATHVARDAPVGFTIPPYLAPNFVEDAGLSSFGEGFIAEEFSEVAEMAALVRQADFWPNEFWRPRWPMSPEVRDSVLSDVNRVVVNLPDSEFFYNGLSFFTGDFHLNAGIVLDRETKSVITYGLPITYYPYREDGLMKIESVEFMGNFPEVPLSEDDDFGPSDFRSLFNLSSIFSAVRNEDASRLEDFIGEYCN